MVLELTLLQSAPKVAAIDNVRPQLGAITFYFTGVSTYFLGIMGAYLARYILFLLN
jgi:hypothetical protein